MWTELAAKKGDPDAVELRDELIKKSSKEVQQLVTSYLKHWHIALCL